MSKQLVDICIEYELPNGKTAHRTVTVETSNMFAAEAVLKHYIKVQRGLVIIRDYTEVIAIPVSRVVMLEISESKPDKS